MQDGHFCIYPIYMDAQRTLACGRKYPMSECVARPGLSEIIHALQRLGIDHSVDTTKRHPRDPFVYGRVHVNRKYGRRYVIGGLVKEIVSGRSAAEVQKAAQKPGKSKEADPKNPLNLVARKKKKGRRAR